MQAVISAIWRLRVLMASVGCMLVLVVALVLGNQLTPPPSTLEEAAAIALRREGIRFRQVSLESVGCIPAPENCQSYSGDIVVMAEPPARGRIVCHNVAQSCELWIAELNLRGMPIPDPAVAGSGGWIEIARTQVQEIRSRYLP